MTRRRLTQGVSHLHRADCLPLTYARGGARPREGRAAFRTLERTMVPFSGRGPRAAGRAARDARLRRMRLARTPTSLGGWGR
jgi:hypothetical protein